MACTGRPQATHQRSGVLEVYMAGHYMRNGWQSGGDVEQWGMSAAAATVYAY